MPHRESITVHVNSQEKVTITYGENLSPLQKVNLVLALLDSLRSEADSTTGVVMEYEVVKDQLSAPFNCPTHTTKGEASVIL